MSEWHIAFNGIPRMAGRALCLAGFISKDDVRESLLNKPGYIYQLPNIGKTSFNQICDWCDVKNPYSHVKRIDDAIKLLTSRGYKITEPPKEQP